MIGAFVGDLAAWTWNNDKKLFYAHLVSGKAEKSMYSNVMLATAEILMRNPEVSSEGFAQSSSNIIGDNHTNIEFSLMRSIVIAWLFDTPDDISLAINNYCLCDDKEDVYASHYIAKLIFALRNGATKNDAAQAEFCGTFRSFTKGKQWQSGQGPIGYLVRAWMSFYDAFDFGCTIHNAAKQPGDIHLNCVLAGALADAMYGCYFYHIKKKYGETREIDLPSFLDNQLYKLNRSKRVFFPKNLAATNIERHKWTITSCPYVDKIIDKELRRRILKAFFPDWDHRFGFYLDDGWVYVYRSFHLLCRFQLKEQADGTYRIVNYQISDELGNDDVEIKNIALHEALNAVEFGWNWIGGE